MDTVISFLAGAASVIAVIIGVVACLFGLIWAIELIRRNRPDRGAFAAFLAAGAPHDHPDLLTALREGLNGDQVRFTPVAMGEITLSSGRVVATDPVYLEEDAEQPFDTEFPSGRFPVTLLHALGPDQRAAALAVHFSRNEVERLEPAFTEAQRRIALPHRQLPSIGVDSATVVLASQEAARALVGMAREDIQPGPDDPSHNPYLSTEPAHLCRWVETPDGGALVVLSGFGDGYYPAWIARAADGAIIALILDFQVLPRQARRRAVPPPPAPA